MTKTGEHRFFNMCRKVAMKNISAKKLYNFGAVLVKGGSIISTGINKAKSDPLIQFMAEQHKGFPQQVHCEVDCLSGVQRHNIRGCVLYIARIKLTDNSFAIARPCNMCEAFLKQHKIKRVYYSITGEPNSPILEYGVLKL